MNDLMIKVALAIALTISHYFPEHLPSLLVNLFWLAVF